MSKPKTTWNYRVMRRKFKGEVEYSIHEVFYKGDRIEGWTQDAVGPHGETLTDVVGVIAMMIEATNKAVLDYKTGKEVE